MGFLSSLLKKKDEAIVIGSPAAGACIALSKVNDPTFSEEILGKGAAVVPTDNRITAPADGTVDMIFPTGHAFTMTTTVGTEILVHIGIDTVKLEGKFFTKHVSDGDSVKKGDLIIEVDLEEIKKAGYDTTIPVIVCNTGDYKEVRLMEERTVSRSDDILEIVKK